MNAVALHHSPWGRVRDRLACALIVVGIILPATAFAQAVNMINGDVTQKVALSDLHAMSDTTFTLYDPYQGRDVEMQGVEFRIPRRPRLLDRCHCILLPQTPTHDG